ncbi:MAG: hypothetical protein ACXVGE_20690 [Blastococcus sp.]
MTLASLIRRVHEESGSADPREIADKVAASLNPDDLADALAEALPEYVRVTIRTVRNRTMGSAPQGSAKVAAVRSWFERLLAQSIDVSGDGGQWKTLADCTRDDLLTAARHRRAIAAKNVHTAETYERLAALLKKGATVAQLDPASVAGVFGRAAA